MNSEDQIIELLKNQSNGVKLKAEYDPDGFMTIGINLVKYYPNGAIIREHDTCTEEQALKWTNNKLYRDVYPDIHEFCRKHSVPKEVYESICVYAFNEGAHLIKTIPFIICLVNKRWMDLAFIMMGNTKGPNIDIKNPPYPTNFSPNKLRKRKIEVDNFKNIEKKYYEIS